MCSKKKQKKAKIGVSWGGGDLQNSLYIFCCVCFCVKNKNKNKKQYFAPNIMFLGNKIHFNNGAAHLNFCN